MIRVILSHHHGLHLYKELNFSVDTQPSSRAPSIQRAKCFAWSPAIIPGSIYTNS
jgi:hypothetical protein